MAKGNIHHGYIITIRNARCVSQFDNININNNRNKIKKQKEKRKILLIGDSHTKGLSSELNHNLECICEITGFVKTNARVQNLVDTNVEELSKLTNRDILVFCGGSNDVSKIVLNRGLDQQINYLRSNQHINIIVISVPQRYDLDSNSCVNTEVNKYNKKLSNLTNV
jgi:lysophospholipase L1-like esterase